MCVYTYIYILFLINLCLINLACGAFCFIKIWPAAHFFHNFFLNRDAFDLKFRVLSTSSLAVKIMIAQHHFNSKTVYKKPPTAGGMPKPTDFDMTIHSDYFVWKDTSERVVRRCDDTVDKKRVNSCVLKHLFLEEVEQPKISPKKPRNTLSD